MNLFCYGSLEFGEVMRVVTGRTFAGEPAELDGFVRYRFRDASYPGLAPEAGGCTEGTLFRGLDAPAIAELDRFEGAHYERLNLEVRTRGGGRAEAQVYVVCAAQRSALSREPWDKAHFAEHDLELFLRRLQPRDGGGE